MKTRHRMSWVCVCVCVVYLQSPVPLFDSLAEFLKQRVSLLLWILQQLTVLRDTNKGQVLAAEPCGRLSHLSVK